MLNLNSSATYLVAGKQSKGTNCYQVVGISSA